MLKFINLERNYYYFFRFSTGNSTYSFTRRKSSERVFQNSSHVSPQIREGEIYSKCTFPSASKPNLYFNQMHLDRGLTPRAHVFNESAFLSGDQMSRVATVSMEKAANTFDRI